VIPLPLTPGRLPAIILVVAFLACHGLFGAAHQASMPAHGAHGGHMPAPLQINGMDGGHDSHQASHHEAGHLASGTAYNAVLFTVLLGMALWLLRGFRPWGMAGVSVFADHDLRIFPVRLHPLRGPTLPALQVLRL